MPVVGLIDYGMGNLDSMRRALEECGAKVSMVYSPKDLSNISHIVLPGVGSYFLAAQQLEERGIANSLKALLDETKIPMLGVCLGMQLLSDYGEEGGGTNGLGLVPGNVIRLKPILSNERIPHVGWNIVEPQRQDGLFQGIGTVDFYFVHSFHFVPNQSDHILSTTPYCGQFVSSVNRDNVWGTQFHPEKSQRAGFKLLKNFLEA